MRGKPCIIQFLKRWIAALCLRLFQIRERRERLLLRGKSAPGPRLAMHAAVRLHDIPQRHTGAPCAVRGLIHVSLPVSALFSACDGRLRLPAGAAEPAAVRDLRAAFFTLHFLSPYDTIKGQLPL